MYDEDHLERKMKAEEFFKKCVEAAETFGLRERVEGRKKQNAVIRKNIVHVENNVRYFAFINQTEAISGPYSDFSLVFLPAGDEEDKYVMALGIGSEGFRNDYELATTPGLRRLFMKLLPGDEMHHPFCKPNFTDIETAGDFSSLEEETNINLDKYCKLLPIGCVIDTNLQSDIDISKAWIAQYALIRKWATTASHRNAIAQAINSVRAQYPHPQYENEVKELLENRRFVILQGAPGTGKTFLAEKIAQKYDKVFFTQFHAETAFSDFVYGIFPKLDSAHVEYEAKYGELCEAIKYASENTSHKVMLIIDEINRANLANVLGPVFYLFEPKRKHSANAINIGERAITEIPINLHVIATMNTADRSIAVVDFALRRRFAWYTIKPQCFETGVLPEGKELFEMIAAIFEKYASDAELNLQPGGAYFMATTKEELNQKIEFELMPLIKEYLEEGIMTSAANDFNALFYQKIQKTLFL